MKVTLPWPDKRLLPNFKRRHHWTVYRPAEVSDKQTGQIAAIAALTLRERHCIAEGDGPILLKITFYPPDNRKRDDDGMVGAFKHMRDGIALALGVDDNRFRPAYFFEQPEKPGRVEVCFV